MSRKIKRPIVKRESYYRDEFAKIIDGEVEVRLDDKTSCDIVTEEYACEVDWANKWAEAVGQSLHYSQKLNKKPAVVLLVKKDSDYLKARFIENIFDKLELEYKIWVLDTNKCEYFKVV